MSQLGDRLRQAREEQGLSLAQAAVETRILQRYLAAIEDGEYQHLPGDVYARGFIRNYALFLGLSPEECIDLYRQEHGSTEQIRVVPTSRLPQVQGCVLPSFFSVFFVVIALVSATYFYLSANGLTGAAPSRPVAVPSAGPPTPQPLPTSTVARVVGADVATPLPPTPQATLPPTALPTRPRPTPTRSAPVVVEVRIKPGDHQGSWLRVESDGVQAFQGTLSAGASQTFDAQRQVSIRAGNAGVVEVSVNGQPPLTLGQYVGQVVDWSFPP